MELHRRVCSLAAVAALCVSALGASGAAQAGDVFWSVGVGSPGVQLGVSNAPPVVYRHPVVVLPQPVYLPQPAVVFQPGSVYYGQPRVIVVPQPHYVQSGWMPPGHRHGWGPRHHGRRGHWEQSRWDRDDDRRGFDGGRSNGGHR